MATIESLRAEKARLEESLRIKLQSLNNINPKFSMNAPYIAKLKVEIANLQSQLAAVNANIKAAETPAPIPAPAPTPQTPPATQETVTEDPFEARRLELEREADLPANEITLTPEEQAAANNPSEQLRLEREQKANRLELAKQATEVEPSSDPGVQKGTPYDDDGNLNPGWTLSENGDPVYVGGGFVEPATQAQADRDRVASKKVNTATIDPPKDWRVRITLAKGSNYLYNAPTPGILAPLKQTGGVIFPYMPTVSVAYNAQYDSQTITHSNFKMHNYTGSSVDGVSITGDFTAQDVTEANYMLAVIHFFRSATKMFYGKNDQDPTRGTPPPLLYLSGFGQYQFDNHPMVLTNFNYSLPVDVDYINAYPDGAGTAINTVSLAPFNKPNTAKPNLLLSGVQRLLGVGLRPGGEAKKPVFVNPPSPSNEITRVPTKISITLSFLPIVTRNAITNGFSLKDYANGSLLRGSKNPTNGGGIW